MAQNLSDDFNRADNDSLGANWTEVLADTDIITNKAVGRTSGYTDSLIVHNTACDSVNQYVKVTWTDGADAGDRVYFVFRYTDWSTPFYLVKVGPTQDAVEWVAAAAGWASETVVGTSDPATWTVASGDSIGVTVDGTGNSVVVRLWKNPTGNAPTSAAVWGGASPDISFTGDPGANAVDSGGKVGTGGSSFVADNVQIDSWWGGDIPSTTVIPVFMNQYRQRGN